MASIKVIFNNEEILNQDLTKDVYVIGRQQECDIYIDNLGISRNHCRLLKNGPVHSVEDMNSANGTFVNGKQITQHNLNNGDEITIGKYIIIYQSEQTETVMDMEGMDPDLPTGLNTMSMDGDAIRKRIEEMKRQKEASGGSVPDTGKAPSGNTKVLDAEVKAREAEIELLKKSLKTVKILVGILVLLLIAAVVAFVVLKGGGA